MAFDGFSLEDHWSHGAARAAVATRSWDVAIMQQGPSALVESQADLRRWATRFAEETRVAGRQFGLLTVWRPFSYEP